MSVNLIWNFLGGQKNEISKKTLIYLYLILIPNTIFRNLMKKPRAQTNKEEVKQEKKKLN